MPTFAPQQDEQPDLVSDFLLSLLDRRRGLGPFNPVANIAGSPAAVPERLGVGDSFPGLEERARYPVSSMVKDAITAPPVAAPGFPTLEPLDTNVTAMPTKPGLPDPITRNRRGEGREAAKGAGLASLIALLASRGNPTAALGAAAGYGQGAAKANDANFADRQFLQEQQIAQQGRDWENEMITAQSAEAARQAKNQGITARNQAATTVYKLRTDAEQKAAALAAKTAAETRAQKKERGARIDRFFAALKDLTPQSQQSYIAMLEQNGELAEMGLTIPKDDSGNYVINIQKAAPQKAADNPDDAKRKQLETGLKEQYRILANPLLKVGMQHEVLSRIARLEKQLGYGDGEIPENLLNEMTPYQKEVIALRKREQGEAERKNKEAEKDRDADRGIAAGNLAARLKGMTNQEKQNWLKSEEKNISEARQANNAERNTKLTANPENQSAIDAEYSREEKELDARAVRARRAVTGKGAPVAEPGEKPKPGQSYRIKSGGTTYIVRPKVKP